MREFGLSHNPAPLLLLRAGGVKERSFRVVQQDVAACSCREKLLCLSSEEFAISSLTHWSRPNGGDCRQKYCTSTLIDRTVTPGKSLI